MKEATQHRLIKFIPKNKQAPVYILGLIKLNILDDKSGQAEVTEWEEATVSGSSVPDIFELLNTLQLSLAFPPLIFSEDENNFTGEMEETEYNELLRKMASKRKDEKVTFAHH